MKWYVLDLPGYVPGGIGMGPMLVVRVGLELLVAIFMGALAGFWLDKETGRAFFPMFSLLGFLLGSSGGMLLVYQTMKLPGKAKLKEEKGEDPVYDKHPLPEKEAKKSPGDGEKLL
ncbi:AtpZ/AtpI family protein [Leptospirillum ferrooxidans]|nr:AtpZ/AtpI family protein [Leptospirillum ferrooxidans]